MTQGLLSFTDRPLSMVARLAQYLTERPNQWIDGRELAQIAGAYAWRSRVSDARRKFAMTIENPERRVNGYTVSEYRYVPQVGCACRTTESAQSGKVSQPFSDHKAGGVGANR